MKWLLGLVIGFLTINLGYAQVVTNPGTVYSANQHGNADYIRSQGDYLESLGRYQIDHETARDLYLKNRKQYIYDRWEVQDEYAKRYYDNSKRIVKVRDSSKTWIGYNGKYYKSFADLKRDPVAWDHMQTEALKRQLRREIEKEVEAEKDRKAIAFLRWWDKADFSEKQRLAADREFRDAAPDLYLQFRHPKPYTKEEISILRIYGYNNDDARIVK